MKDLDAVVGSNDEVMGKEKLTPWICLGCGTTIKVKQFQDKAKHMTKCPANPFK